MERLKLTLDWNCAIAVEEERPKHAECVRQLIRLHRSGEIEVALLAASASENTKDKVLAPSSGIFGDRINALGWNDLPLVKVPMVIGLTYIGAHLIADANAFKRDTDAIWSALFPSVPSDPRLHLAEGEPLTDATIQGVGMWKWRNKWCDVISAYSHIYARRDMFVTTNTADFQKHARQLAELGMTAIATPEEALQFIEVQAAPSAPAHNV